MEIKKVPITSITEDPNNPRVIRDEKFKSLVKSLKEFPEMLEVRPIVVNPNNQIIGGNMRMRAAKELGLKEIPVAQVTWSEAEQEEFTIKDNVSYGEWDWDILANEWNADLLNDWGLGVWDPQEEPDYSVLDDEQEPTEELSDGLRKAVCIDFSPEDHQIAADIVKRIREENGDAGAVVLALLRKYGQNATVK